MLFRLRTGSAWLLEDKKRCRMVSDERYVTCDRGVGEDVTILHLLVGCEEFERDRLLQLDDVYRIVGGGGAESVWMNFGEWMKRERWHCCWEKG